MYILKRAPFDEFTLRLFVQMSAQLPEKHDSFYVAAAFLTDYMWTEEHPEVLKSQGIPVESENQNLISGPKSFYKDLIKKNIKHDVVLIGVKDHLTELHHNPWVDKRPSVLDFFIPLFETHKDKKFIFCTSVENLDHYLDLENVFIVPWGGDLTNQIFDYRTINPIIAKTSENQKNFLCLNRHHRFHREMLISLLINMDLIQNSLVSCMFKNSIKNEDKDFWLFEKRQESIKESFFLGRELIGKTEFSINDGYEIYNNFPNDNVSNFNNVLANYYRSTCVEVITETTFFEKTFLLTEKTANCILGCCFPIWVSSQGTVAFLRNRGFDVFDDIIDHSYDLIENPIDRLYQSISLNRHLLLDKELSFSLWKNCQNRFLNNVTTLKYQLIKFYENRACAIFQSYLKNKCMILS